MHNYVKLYAKLQKKTLLCLPLRNQSIWVFKHTFDTILYEKGVFFYLYYTFERIIHVVRLCNLDKFVRSRKRFTDYYLIRIDVPCTRVDIPDRCPSLGDSNDNGGQDRAKSNPHHSILPHDNLNNMHIIFFHKKN